MSTIRFPNNYIAFISAVGILAAPVFLLAREWRLADAFISITIASFLLSALAAVFISSVCAFFTSAFFKTSYWIMFFLSLAPSFYFSHGALSYLSYGRMSYDASALIAKDKVGTVMTYNVFAKHFDVARFRDWVVNQSANVVFLQEIPAGTSIGSYPHEIYSPAFDDDGYSVALLSRWPVIEHGFIKSHGRYFIHAKIDTPAGAIMMVGVHAASPVTEYRFDRRNAYFADVASFLLASELPYIVAGDFNAALASPHLRSFLKTSGMLVAEPSGATWISQSTPFLSATIDHIASSGAAPVLSKSRILRGVGLSDHRAVEADLYHASN